MKIPRDIQGETLALYLTRDWGYVRVHQTGSHIVLRTGVPAGQTLSIPSHSPLKLGTLAAILRAVAQHKGVSRDHLLTGLL